MPACIGVAKKTAVQGLPLVMPSETPYQSFAPPRQVSRCFPLGQRWLSRRIFRYGHPGGFTCTWCSGQNPVHPRGFLFRPARKTVLSLRVFLPGLPCSRSYILSSCLLSFFNTPGVRGSLNVVGLAGASPTKGGLAPAASGVHGAAAGCVQAPVGSPTVPPSTLPSAGRSVYKNVHDPPSFGLSSTPVLLKLLVLRPLLKMLQVALPISIAVPYFCRHSYCPHIRLTRCG